MSTLPGLGVIDAPKAAGLLALGAIGLLVVLRRGFGGVAIKLGD